MHIYKYRNKIYTSLCSKWSAGKNHCICSWIAFSTFIYLFSLLKGFTNITSRNKLQNFKKEKFRGIICYYFLGFINLVFIFHHFLGTLLVFKTERQKNMALNLITPDSNGKPKYVIKI